jgi:uncharacterized protein YdhG (YjbR/CyaY superfamily)
MTKLAEIQEAIQSLPPKERAELRNWLVEEESPELLAAIDLGLRSYAEHGARVVSKEELKQKVRSWATGSR